MDTHDPVNFTDRRNAGVLSYLKSRQFIVQYPPSIAPAAVDKPYWNLGTHPDLVERLWDDLTRDLPADCRWVLYGTPVLVHPQSGIVFGFAHGTYPYALRLPPAVRDAALAAEAKRVHTYSDGSRLDLATLGPEWVMGGWRKGEEAWGLAAYEAAEL